MLEANCTKYALWDRLTAMGEDSFKKTEMDAAQIIKRARIKVKECVHDTLKLTKHVPMCYVVP